MSASHDSQKRLNGKFHRFLQERIEKANPRRELKHEKAKRLSKLEAIAGKLRHTAQRVFGFNLYAEG